MSVPRSTSTSRTSRTTVNLGVLVPYFNSVVQPELEALRPSQVSNQTARFSLDADVLDDIAQAAEKLCACGLEALIVGLTTESFPGGLELLEQGMTRLRDTTSLPVVSATHANFAALESLGVKRISLATPFDDASNEHVREAYEARGFEVVAAEGLAISDLAAIARTPEPEIEALFARADRSDPEALVQVGTGLPVGAMIDSLEATHAKPVIASNAASYWQALREIGITDPVRGFGRLLAEY